MTEPNSEAVERPWASNDKVQFDNLISHCKRMDEYGELSIKQAIDFQQKSNDAYLIAQRQLLDESLKHSADRDSASLENNRYTLDRLYSVFGEEAVGLTTMFVRVMEALKKEGVVPEK